MSKKEKIIYIVISVVLLGIFSLGIALINSLLVEISNYQEQISQLKNENLIPETVTVVEEIVTEVEVPIELKHLAYAEDLEASEAEDMLPNLENKIEVLNNLINVLSNEYAETDEIIKWLNQEVENTENILSLYNDLISSYKKTITAEIENSPSEEDAVNIIWNTFKSYGWNDAVCAGIIGNIMCEVGGQSMKIYYWLDLNGYYGMCMWNKGYNPDVAGRDLNGQCIYLKDTLKPQFDAFGSYSGYSYESFMNLTSPEEAALVFAEVYERCTSTSYGARQNNARAAYEYFCN